MKKRQTLLQLRKEQVAYIKTFTIKGGISTMNSYGANCVSCHCSQSLGTGRTTSSHLNTGCGITLESVVKTHCDIETVCDCNTNTCP